MGDLDLMKPKTKGRVIDLVEQAGFDISGWSKDFEGHASRNPKFCYEWTFTDPDRGIILNLWHPQFEEVSGEIFRRGNFRNDALHLVKSIGKKRARKMDTAVKMAFEARLPVQIIVVDGVIRSIDSERSSEVHVRGLDREFWHVAEYNDETGEHRIVRGGERTQKFVDQFSIPNIGREFPDRQSGTSNKFNRDPKVRQWALARANGRCEYCGAKGFKTASGYIYLETHHIIALSKGGSDLVTNVIALCPNDHRQAHYGEFRDQLEHAFFAVIKAIDVSEGV